MKGWINWTAAGMPPVHAWVLLFVLAGAVCAQDDFGAFDDFGAGLTQEERVTHALAEVEIPALEFSEASVVEIANALQEQMRKVEPERAILVTAAAAGIEETFTASLKASSLLRMLDVISVEFNLVYRLRENVIILDKGEEKLKRFYSVDPSLFDERVGRMTPDGAEFGDDGGFGDLDAGDFDDFGGGGGVGDLKGLFTNYGVPFPPGTSIRYDPLVSQLIVVQTAANLDKFEDILHSPGHSMRQVEISGSFVSFAKADFNALGKAAELATTAELIALRKKGAGRMLQPFKVVTINGVNAVVENVQEIIYPTEFDVGDNDVTLQSEIGDGDGVFFTGVAQAIPGAFETREVGQIMNVTPTVSPDNETINLTLLPEVAELVGWRDVGFSYRDVKGVERHMPMKQPTFKSRNVTSSLIVKDGRIVTLGGGWSADREAFTVIFISARLLNLDGTFLRP